MLQHTAKPTNNVANTRTSDPLVLAGTQKNTADSNPIVVITRNANSAPNLDGCANANIDASNINNNTDNSNINHPENNTNNNSEGTTTNNNNVDNNAVVQQQA